MPVPFFANLVEDREVLLEQRGGREVFDMAEKAGLKFVGLAPWTGRHSSYPRA